MLLSMMILLATACSSNEPETAFTDLPDGNIKNGESLFNQEIDDAPSCASCHRTDSSKNQGPGLGGFGDRASKEVKDQSAEEYAYYSILRPSKHLVSGYSNMMYRDYEEKLSDQELADLIAYILSL